MVRTLTDLQRKLDTIELRGRRLNRAYDNAPDGSDAKTRALEEMSILSKERCAVEAEMEAAWDEMEAVK